jgi:hypothetical protein
MIKRLVEGRTSLSRIWLSLRRSSPPELGITGNTSPEKPKELASSTSRWHSQL